MRPAVKQAVWRAFSTIVGALAVFVAGAAFYLMPKHELSAFEQKKKNAKTLLMYELSPNGSVELSVLPGDDTFYLLSHVVVPTQLRYDPHKQWVYALRAAFIDNGGREVHTQTYFEQTRQSKADPIENGFLLENAFLPPGDKEVTDERLSVLSCGEILPQGGRIRVTLTHSNRPALLRIYRIEQRTDLQRLKRYHLMAEHRKDRLATYMGLESLEDLALDELVDVFARKWRRVEATLPGGGEPKKRRMYHTGFRLPPEVTDDSLVPIDPGRRVAFNLRGPVSLAIEGKGREERGNSARFPVKALSLCACPQECEGLKERELVLSADNATRLELGPGDQTLVIANPNPVEPRKIRVLVKNEPHRLIGYARAVEGTAGSDDRVALLPEDVDMDAVIVDPGEEKGVSFSTLGANGSRLLRLDVRAVLAGPRDEAPRPFEIGFSNREGHNLAKVSREHTAVPTFFEGLVASGEETKPRPWLSESSSFYLVPGASTRRITVTSSQRLLVRAFVRHAPVPPQQGAYPEPCEGRAWRFQHGLEDEWMQLDPEEWKELQGEDRLVAVAGITRLEEDAETAAEELPGVWQRVPPAQEGYEEIVYSQTDANLEETTAEDFPDSLRVACPADVPVTIPLPADANDDSRGVLDFLYYVPPGVELDGTIEVRRGDSLIAAVEPLTRKNTYRSRRVARVGSLTWTHDFEPEPPVLYFAAQPRTKSELAALSDCRLFKAFYVTPIPPGQSRRFIARRPASIDTYVNFEVYGAEPTGLTLIVDGGRPRRKAMRVATGFTRGRYEHVLEIDKKKQVWMPSRAQFPLRAALTVSAPLHGDLTPGVHTVKAHNEGTSTIWVRSFQRVDTPVHDEKIRVKVRSLR